MSEVTGKPLGLPDHAEGGLEAPVIYFESAPCLGVGPGIGRIALEMVIYDPAPEGVQPSQRRKIVAQLRGPLSAFADLRAAINQMEVMVTPPQGGEKPN